MAKFSLTHLGGVWTFKEEGTGITFQGGFDKVRGEAHKAFQHHATNVGHVDDLFAREAEKADLNDLKPPTQV